MTYQEAKKSAADIWYFIKDEDEESMWLVCKMDNIKRRISNVIALPTEGGDRSKFLKEVYKTGSNADKLAEELSEMTSYDPYIIFQRRYENDMVAHERADGVWNIEYLRRPTGL